MIMTSKHVQHSPAVEQNAAGNKSECASRLPLLFSSVCLSRTGTAYVTSASEMEREQESALSFGISRLPRGSGNNLVLLTGRG